MRKPVSHPMFFKNLILILILLDFVSYGQAETVWRGTQRDGIYNEQGLLKKWGENGPQLLFSVENIGSGYSSPAVTSDRIYVTGMIDKIGHLFSLDMQGKILWKSSYGQEWSTSHSGVRGTPTVAGSFVYIQSGKGRITCFNTTDGKEVWAVDMGTLFGGTIPKWGHAETMLINGDQLICTPGGSKAAIVALNPKTGKTLWTTPTMNQKSGYCSPVLMNHGGITILVTMLEKSILAVDPTTGKLLWKIKHETDYGVNPNTPIYSNGTIIYFSGYKNGAGMLKLSADGKRVSPVWRQKLFDVQMGGAILEGNFLYGSGHKNKGWHCLDITSGKIIHSMKTIDGGCVIYAEGLLYTYSESGTFSLVKPGNQDFKVISSFKISQGEGPHWAHPVIKEGKLFVRHGTVLMVYKISA